MCQLRAGGLAFEVPGRFDSPVPWTPPPAQLTVRRPDRDGQAVVIADPQKLTSGACEIPRWIIGGSSLVAASVRATSATDASVNGGTVCDNRITIRVKFLGVPDDAGAVSNVGANKLRQRRCRDAILIIGAATG